MTREQEHELVRNFLQDKRQMTLATYGEHPWVATLYFAFDEDLSLYFLSDPSTMHCQHIEQNNQVAVAVADSPQPPSAKKKSLQMYGTATLITDEHEIARALDIWKRGLDVSDEKYTYEGMQQGLIKGRMYEIQPKKCKYMNQELWPEGGELLVAF